MKSNLLITLLLTFATSQAHGMENKEEEGQNLWYKMLAGLIVKKYVSDDKPETPEERESSLLEKKTWEHNKAINDTVSIVAELFLEKTYTETPNTFEDLENLEKITRDCIYSSKRFQNLSEKASKDNIHIDFKGILDSYFTKDFKNNVSSIIKTNTSETKE